MGSVKNVVASARHETGRNNDALFQVFLLVLVFGIRDAHRDCIYLGVYKSIQNHEVLYAHYLWQLVSNHGLMHGSLNTIAHGHDHTIRWMHTEMPKPCTSLPIQAHCSSV